MNCFGQTLAGVQMSVSSGEFNDLSDIVVGSVKLKVIVIV